MSYRAQGYSEVIFFGFVFVTIWLFVGEPDLHDRLLGTVECPASKVEAVAE